MQCPFCGARDTKVLDSRPAEHRIRRRRECIFCGKRFTTYEMVERPLLMVKKRDGSFEPFDRQKLITGILNQGLILLIFYVTLTVASWLVQAVLGIIPIIGGILSGLVQLAVSVCIIALIVFGMVQAAQGKATTLPVIGKFHLIG